MPEYKRYLDEMPGCPFRTFGTILRHSIPKQASGSAIRHKSRSRCWNASSQSSSERERHCSGCVLWLRDGAGGGAEPEPAVDWDRCFSDGLPCDGEAVARRLQIREDENLWLRGKGFVVRDLPWTEKQLRTIPPFEFENWAVIALGGIPNKTQVGDMGIDGRIYPVGSEPQRAEGRRRTRLHGRLVSDSGEADGQGGTARHRQVRGGDDAGEAEEGIFCGLRLQQRRDAGDWTGSSGGSTSRSFL